MTPTETILSNPIAASLLTILLVLAVVKLQPVGPRRAIALERVRIVAQPLVERILHSRGVERLLGRLIGRTVDRDLTRDKTEEADPNDGGAEYITHYAGGLLALAKALWSYGYRWNPLSTKKYRIVDGGRQYALLSVAYRDGVLDESQHHVYIFRSVDGSGYDVCGHQEANVTDVDDHEGGDELAGGDPVGHVQAALEDAGISGQPLPSLLRYREVDRVWNITKLTGGQFWSTKQGRNHSSWQQGGSGIRTSRKKRFKT